ncbi:MAG: hypothetical protein LV480_01645 [Methylacidiphilales bacterium]|nr:hypothetical protein [Candidatus Methylacidiphilales bacterium]
MKILFLILGVVFTVSGVGLTGYSWYSAASEGRIIEGMAYPGPFLLVVGLWRLLSAATAAAPPTLFRIIAVGLGIAAGYGNVTALKAIFPGDKQISSTPDH